MKSWALVCLFVCAVGFSTTSHAQTSDRIKTSLTSGQMIALKGNVHGLAKPEFDLGRADGSRLIEGMSLVFRPSASQQKDLDNFIKQLGDPSSPNYHKYLTPKQFGARFGLSQNDIDTTTAWLVSHGFSNIKVANNRNHVFFDGTVAQVESAFSVEMHNYSVNGVTHLANAGEPSVPAGLAGSVLQVTHLNDFAPKPRAKVKSHLTSYVSGNHFLSPDDFATIYDIQPLYAGGFDGTGQTIAVVGQSTVSATDLSNFRSAAGLSPSTVTMTLQGGTATKCSGDEGESDLDLEWAGGVAKGAQIIFVYAGLTTGDSCTGNRLNSVWDALQYAVDNKVAPFISSSYGFCEVGLGTAFAGPNGTLEGWTKQAITQGQTITSATGDAGAADCDSGTSATQGYAVDAPASLPEVTGAGGTRLCSTDVCPAGDSPNYTTNNPPGADPPYWSAAGATSDTISSALTYIPETAWNDTTLDIQNGGGLSSSGGGASIYYTKPSWQTGTGVPADGWRDVPDVSVTASADHDGYLVCSEDNSPTPCASGFRDSAGGGIEVVGGTSAAAPTVSAIFAILNQYFAAAPGIGLAPVNGTLYTLAASNPSAFHDVTTGDNKVPCTTGTTDCPSGVPIGFAAGPGYDQVTGLGSMDVNALALVWAPTIPSFTLTAGTLTPTSVAAGGSATTTVTIAPLNGFTESVNLTCPTLPAGVTCSWNPTSVAGGGGTSQLTLSTTPDLAASTAKVTLNGTSTSRLKSSTVSLPLTATTETFGLSSQPAVSNLTVKQGQTSTAVNIVVTSTSTPSFLLAGGQQTAVAVMYTCQGLPSESTCTFTPTNPTNAASVTLTIATTAPTAKMQAPLNRGAKFFYASLVPGFFGIVLFTLRRRKITVVRMMMLVVLLVLSMLWMTSCGGSNSSGGGTSNPGTPAGTYAITVNGKTAGSGTAPLSASVALTFNLTVTQ